MNFAWQGSSIVIGGIAIVDDPAPNPVDNFLVRLENDLLFADGFE
jgi:hypothetical protein